MTTTRTPSEALHRLAEEARAAWPGVAFEAREFLESVTVGFEGEGLHTADLFLATACAHRAPGALEAFERSVVPEVRVALLARKESPEATEDALQLMRQRLFVDGRIADYGGRGSLATWAKMAAIRLALNQRRSTRRETLSDEMPTVSEVPTAAAELGYIKARYRPGFKRAFEDAFAALEVRDRAVLRLVLVDGLKTSQVARMYKVDASTVRRWLADARQVLLARTRELVTERLGIEPAELDSLVGVLASQFEASVCRVLSEGGEPRG